MAAEVQHIACLGSTFAAGPGIPPIVDGNASRSGRNYARQVAQRLGARLTDLSVSGATLLNILSEPQTVAPKTRYPAQIEGLPNDVDLVLLTAGGTDLSYTSDMVKQAIRATWIGWLLFLILSFLPVPRSKDMTQAELNGRLDKVLDAIHARAPQARVLLVEHLALLGDDDAAAQRIGFTPAQIHQHKRKADRLMDAYAQAAQNRAAWCAVVRMHDVSKAHVIGTPQPWIQGFTLYDVAVLRKVPFHPTLAGMTATADRIVEHIRDGDDT